MLLIVLNFSAHLFILNICHNKCKLDVKMSAYCEQGSVGLYSTLRRTINRHRGGGVLATRYQIRDDGSNQIYDNLYWRIGCIYDSSMDTAKLTGPDLKSLDSTVFDATDPVKNSFYKIIDNIEIVVGIKKYIDISGDGYLNWVQTKYGPDEFYNLCIHSTPEKGIMGQQHLVLKMPWLVDYIDKGVLSWRHREPSMAITVNIKTKEHSSAFGTNFPFKIQQSEILLTGKQLHDNISTQHSRIDDYMTTLYYNLIESRPPIRSNTDSNHIDIKNISDGYIAGIYLYKTNHDNVFKINKLALLLKSRIYIGEDVDPLGGPFSSARLMSLLDDPKGKRALLLAVISFSSINDRKSLPMLSDLLFVEHDHKLRLTYETLKYDPAIFKITTTDIGLLITESIFIT